MSLAGKFVARRTVSRSTKCGSPHLKSAMSTSSSSFMSTAIRLGKTIRFATRSPNVVRTMGLTVGKSATRPAPYHDNSIVGGLMKNNSKPPKNGGLSKYGRKTTEIWPSIRSFDTPTCTPRAERMTRTSVSKRKRKRISTSRLSCVDNTLNGPNFGGVEPKDTSSKLTFPFNTSGSRELIAGSTTSLTFRSSHFAMRGHRSRNISSNHSGSSFDLSSQRSRPSQVRM
mmetsp:Transcript_21614/g.61869  ORF Transcript_21614/g.61869 Transcript_21614/m.61869 type:complete len:227 (-) Transcript_21614:18-698(-)